VAVYFWGFGGRGNIFAAMIKNQIVYKAYRFGIQNAEGSYLFDKRGKRYIDFTSGWNAANLGFNNSEITAAMTRQVQKNSASAMWLSFDVQERLAKELTAVLPGELSVVMRATGGSEANEMAYKLARAYTRRKRILALAPSYHGQTFTSLGLGGSWSHAQGIQPFMDGLGYIDFPNVSGSSSLPDDILKNFSLMLEEELKSEDVAAVITEAGIVTGFGSVATAPPGFMACVREMTEKYGTLFILDEVGTGFSRCGRLFGMEVEGVMPDIVTFAKGMSNGVAPIGAVVTTKLIAEKAHLLASLISTFGWLPISVAAALATLRIHLREKIWEKAEADGEYMREVLATELGARGLVHDVRGRGMITGLDFLGPDVPQEKAIRMTRQTVERTEERGLHLVSSVENVIQLMPPLTISRSVLDEGLEVLVQTIRGL